MMTKLLINNNVAVFFSGYETKYFRKRGLKYLLEKFNPDFVLLCKPSEVDFSADWIEQKKSIEQNRKFQKDLKLCEELKEKYCQEYRVLTDEITNISDEEIKDVKVNCPKWAVKCVKIYEKYLQS